MKVSLFSLVAFVLLLAGSCTTKKDVGITPEPLSYSWGKGSFEWNKDTRIAFDGNEDAQQIVKTAFSETRFPVTFGAAGEGGNCIRLEVVDSISGVTSPEAYSLHVGKDGVAIKALSDAGLFYGVQSLIQLAEQGKGSVQAIDILDEPRFPYRGIMLDVSRHFRSKDFVKKQIDLLSHYKFNRLHLHLTDAAGWRIAIDKYPRLTQYAAWRKGKTWKEWSNSGANYCEETDPEAQGGYYTKDDIREMVEYARQHCITIIPEIEMPSHSDEVLAAYPELSCTHEPGKQSDFCVGNEKTFEFLEDVLTEVMELFPSEYIHIGGDEASKASWKTCPLCQKRMKEEGLKDVDELQSYLIHRIERFLNDHGRNLLGWDEILQGGLAPNATVMSWRGEQGGIDAALSGHHAIMTPGEYCYFDAYQDAPYSQPEAIGGYLPLSKVYFYNPVPDSLSTDIRKMILGVQANLWAEYIPTDEHMEYMLYPRAIALAEVAWTVPERKSWDFFRERILKIIPELKAKGYNSFDYAKEIGNRKEYDEPVKHLAVGKKVTFNIPYWPNYPANGDKTLNDGLRGGWNYNDKRWLGFADNHRMDVVIDLEKVMKIHSVSAEFMQICGPYVFMPSEVIISSSVDGKEYTQLTAIHHQVQKDDSVSFKKFGWDGETDARYVRYQAMADSLYKDGIQFVDEIIVK